jgi:hypothetical protein
MARHLNEGNNKMGTEAASLAAPMSLQNWSDDRKH